MRGGVSVAVGNLDADKKLKILIGAAVGGDLQLAMYDLNNSTVNPPTLLKSFAQLYTFNGNPSNAPLRVAALAELDSMGNLDTNIFLRRVPMEQPRNSGTCLRPDRPSIS